MIVEPKNSLIKQYKKLFEMETVDLEFSKDALQLIAEKALARKTGARGLRSILEQILLNIMYDLPSLVGVHKVVIDAATVRGESEPLLVYENTEMPRSNEAD